MAGRGNISRKRHWKALICVPHRRGSLLRGASGGKLTSERTYKSKPDFLKDKSSSNSLHTVRFLPVGNKNQDIWVVLTRHQVESRRFRHAASRL